MDKHRFQALAFAHGLSEEALLEVCETLEKNGWQPPIDLSGWKDKGPSTLIIDDRKPTLSQGLSQQSNNNAEFDRYEVLGKIGEGGMGEVYRVYDPKLNRNLALKCMSVKIMEYEHTVTQFIEEAQLTAQLHHPGIVPVHDFGRLGSGQFYFTMPIIQGRTLRSVINEVFSNKVGPESNWNQRRLLEVFRQACDTIGYAHARGVIHCDIKPDNIMIGKFGEVYVLDWGVAQTLGRVSEMAPVQIRVPGADPINTSFTPMMGTPQYMAPEQAEGKHEDLNARSDVYSLGLVLYHILCGKKAYPGSGTKILDRVKKGEKEPLESPLPITDSLKEIYERATEFEPVDRYADAGDLARDLGLWLDGIKKQERAMKLVGDAIAKLPEAEALAKEANTRFNEAKTKLAEIPVWFPEEEKWPAWAIEDEAVKLDLKAHQLELDFRLILHSALSHDPDLVEAHRYLADYYQQCHVDAEAAQDSDMLQRMEGMLRLHAQALPDTHIARVRHAAYLKGYGALTIFTEPEGAKVTLYRYEEKNRRLTPVKFKEMGVTPIIEAPIPSGSYLAEIIADGHSPVLYPITIDRLGHWDGVPPGRDWPQTIRLPAIDDLTSQDAYVPQGWFQCGSPRSPGAFMPQNVWVDAFIMKKEPVTNNEYVDFLNDLLDQGKEELALSVAPRDKSGITGADAPLILGRDNTGRFHLTRDTEGDLWLPSWPIVMIDWNGAREYAKWMREKTGQPWRLPFELEWEKAARGTDGRHYPWGNDFVHTRCNNRHSVEKRPLPAGSLEYPLDESPYGILGMAGNVSDWCIDHYSKDPNVDEYGQAKTEIVEGQPHLERVMRGGSWVGSHETVSLGRRLSNLPISRLSSCSVRLCRSIKDSND